MKQLRSFDDNTHLYGRIWGLIAALLILSYPFVCLVIFGASIDWGLFASGASIIILYCVVGAVETFTYTPMLGSGGTYLGFVTGNLSNLKVPCALNCMEQAGVEKGTEEAEIVSTISIAVSSIVTMLILVLGVVLISFLTPVFENETLAPRSITFCPPCSAAWRSCISPKTGKFPSFPACSCCSYSSFPLTPRAAAILRERSSA